MNIDDVFDYVGGWGGYQKLLYFLVFIAGVPNAFVNLQFLFNHYETDFHCKLPDILLNFTGNITEESKEFLSHAIPRELDTHGEPRWSQCYMYNRNYSLFGTELWPEHLNQSNDVISCTNGFTYELGPHKSAITEFDLVCDDDWKVPTAVAVYLAGKAVGSLCGSLADKFGRRTLFLWSTFLQVFTTVFVAVSWNFQSYLVAMFTCGCSAMVNYVAAFVLATEVTSHDWRNFMAISTMYCYVCGYLMVPAIGYLTPNWRWFLWMISLMSALFYAPHYWCLPESVRWLLTKKRLDEAIKELRRMARMNGKLEIFERLLNEKLNELENIECVKEHEAGLLVAIRMILKSSISARCLAVIYGWFVTCMIYYSISYYSTTFSEDYYLNILYSGLSEIPGYLSGFLLVRFIGTPRPLMLLMMLCGCSSIVLPFLPRDFSIIKTIISMLGKAAVSAVFYALYLVTSEISPTLHRNTTMCVGSAVGRFGSFLAPFLMYLGKFHPSVPNFTMGGLAFLCAALSIAFIPETKGVFLPDSIEEAKSNKRFYGFNIFKKMPIQNSSNYIGGTKDVKERQM